MKTRESFPEALDKYADKWIAITSDRKLIIAFGDTLREAASSADSEGYSNPILMRVPNFKECHLL